MEDAVKALLSGDIGPYHVAILLILITWSVWRDWSRNSANRSLVAAKEEQIQRIARECAAYRHELLKDKLLPSTLAELNQAVLPTDEREKLRLTDDGEGA